jgi:hypothetical protein
MFTICVTYSGNINLEFLLKDDSVQTADEALAIFEQRSTLGDAFKNTVSCIDGVVRIAPNWLAIKATPLHPTPSSLESAGIKGPIRVM